VEVTGRKAEEMEGDDMRNDHLLLIRGRKQRWGF
jgi:hypothetical protein